MSQSVLGDVLSVYENNKEAATAALKGMDEETKKEKSKKVRELQELFPEASDHAIDKALHSTNYDVDEAIVSLFNLTEDQKRRARVDEARTVQARGVQPRGRGQKDQQARRGEEAKKQAETLMEAFKSLPKAQIQGVLDENEGDIEETTTQLLAIVALQEEDGTEKEKERMKHEQELRLRELKIQALEEKFDDLSEREVIQGLETAAWDIKRAYTELTRVSASKRNNPIVVKKVQQNLLERSLLLGQQVEDEVLASHIEFQKALNEESHALFRNNLEHIIETQARHGVAPGMSPPLPKQIDRLLNKGEPVSQSIEVAEPEPIQKPSPVQVECAAPKESQVVLQASPAYVDASDQITVTWQMNKGESSAYDWIGIFPVDQPNKQYLTYQWRGKGDTNKGEITFTAPTQNGKYEFRYFSNNSYAHLAISNQIEVGPRFQVSARLENGKFIASWKQISGHSYSRQWIGLYEKPQVDNRTYLTWEYATSADVEFEVPVKPQDYEFRFFSNSYQDLARSNSLKIEGEDKLSAVISDDFTTITATPHIVSVDPYYDGTWLGVFFTSEQDNRQWRRYKYVAERNTPVVFKAPRTAGTYEVRLFANKTYNALLTSNSFVIQSAK